MEACKVNDTVPLKSVVKAAAIDLGEDYLRVDAIFSHWAARGLNKINRETLRGGLKRAILNVHANLKTVKLPVDCELVVFVGWIDDCGCKVPFTQKGNIAVNVAEEDCSDRCEKCNQDLDVCEDLVIEEVIELVTFPPSEETYERKINRFFEGGRYVEVVTTPVWNFAENEVEYKTTRKVITEFDMLQCGCVAKTESNEEKMKTHCYDHWCKCYSPCAESQEDYGGYKIMQEDGIIQFERNFPFKKVYIEFHGSLPKIKGQLHVPKVAFETLVAFIKFKNGQHKKSLSLQERRELERFYEKERDNMFIIICRIPLSTIINSVRRIPKFNINGNAGVKDIYQTTFLSNIVYNQY